MAPRLGDVESQLEGLRSELDLQLVHSQYWMQHEFVVLEHALPRDLVDRLIGEARALESALHRNYIPGHKKGGSIGYFTLRNRAPAILSLYRSPAFRWFLSRITESDLLLCPERDPHACALYYYTKPGDHIGFHYDRSYYKGRRYSIFVGLVERSTHCRLIARVRTDQAPHEIRETCIPMEPGSVVIFNGDKLWHGVTPLWPGEERIVLSLQYVTDQAMGPVNRLFSNMKDAFAYFGPAVFMNGKRVSVNAKRGEG